MGTHRLRLRHDVRRRAPLGSLHGRRRRGRPARWLPRHHAPPGTGAGIPESLPGNHGPPCLRRRGERRPSRSITQRIRHPRPSHWPDRHLGESRCRDVEPPPKNHRRPRGEFLQSANVRLPRWAKRHLQRNMGADASRHRRRRFFRFPEPGKMVRRFRD